MCINTVYYMFLPVNLTDLMLLQVVACGAAVDQSTQDI